MPSIGNVLIIVENLPVPLDRRVWQEARTLQASGYRVSVICPQGKDADASFEVLENVRIYRHPLPPEGKGLISFLIEYAHALLWEFSLARKIARRERIDIVHICNPPDLLFLIAAWLKRRGARVIFDQHDLCPEIWAAKTRRGGWMRRILLGAETWSYRLADAVLVPNRSYYEVALGRGRLTGDRVFIVRNAPRGELFFPPRTGGPSHASALYRVGYVGVMGKQDGLEYLLRTIRAIVHDWGRCDIRFVLIGDGPERPRLERTSQLWGIDSFIEFTGRIPDADLIARLAACDVCVDPDPKTPFNDRSTMNKILEYMSLARPIVQYDLLEGRRSARAASLYAVPNDPEDFGRKILWLLEHPEVGRKMGKFGRRRYLRRLQWKHQEPRLLAAYSSVRGGGAST